jgi:hypothetical protein
MTYRLFHDSDILVERQGLKIPRWLKFVSPASFLLVLFVLVVIYQSVFDTHPPPMRTGAATARGHSGRLATLITYTRNVVVNDDVVAVVSRQLDCQGHPLYDFPESTRKYDEGSRTASRSLVVPFSIDPGTHCRLLSSYSYKPTFSISWHYVSVAPIYFTIEAAEE